MGLKDTLSFIWNHPLSEGRQIRNLGRFVTWQIRSNLLSGPFVVQFAGGSRLLVHRRQTGATGNIYVGLHDFADMAFTVHALRPHDLFVDIGANVGTYTVLAGAVAQAECIAVEPSPDAFESLERNVDLNGVAHRVQAHNIALGSREGRVTITTDRGPMNHVTTIAGDSTKEVPMATLDELLSDMEPLVVKADIEGYEGEMLKGAARLLRGSRPMAWIIELNGSGKRYEYSDAAVSALLTEHSFAPFRYEPFDRDIVPLPRPNEGGNTLFIRGSEHFHQRVKSAQPFTVIGKTL